MLYTKISRPYLRGSRNFRQGGPGQSDKKALTTFFLSPQLFFRSQKDNFKENYHFQGSRGGPTFSRGGGSNFFQGGGGGPIAYSLFKPILFVIFQGGGGRTPCPPSLWIRICPRPYVLDKKMLSCYSYITNVITWAGPFLTTGAYFEQTWYRPTS